MDIKLFFLKFADINFRKMNLEDQYIWELF